MKDRLTYLYGGPLHVVVVSNASTTDPPLDTPRARTSVKTIGFISNLTRSKGVLDFLDVAEGVCAAYPDVRAVLAGKIEEPALRTIITRRLMDAPWITYVGPIYDDTKSRFYAAMDVLVFPSRHVDEADPRVIDEALAHGVVIVARARGCIKSVVQLGGGTVFEDKTDFVREAVNQVKEWHQNPAFFSSVSSAALANSARLQADYNPRLGALISTIVSNPDPRADSGSLASPLRSDDSKGDEQS
jgi:glycosyltransferase involved in cell wall biosynthesis